MEEFENEDDGLYLATVHADPAQMFMFDALVSALHHTGNLSLIAFTEYLDKADLALESAAPAALPAFRRNRSHLAELLRKLEAERPGPRK